MDLFERLWGALSQFLNVLLLNGHPNESISGRAWREPWPRAVRVLNALFFWQKNHCEDAYVGDVEWAKQCVIESRYRTLQARRHAADHQ